MAIPSHPREPQYSSTYFVQGQQSEEFQRLVDQDRFITASMGGVLAEQTDLSAFRRVLDIASGPGSWAIEAAQTYPEMSLVGIDIDPRVVEFANAQAAAQQVDERVVFQTMDALQALRFPDDSFDLVNMRFGMGFLRTWEWPRVLIELLRVVRPGGIVRITDGEVVSESSSPALLRFFEMFLCALFRSGHFFTQEGTGIISYLVPMLGQRGYHQVQTRAYILHYHVGTAEGQAYIENMLRIFQTFRPFLQKWGCLSKDYDAICQQAIQEMQQPDFFATWHLLTAWGAKPEAEV